MQHEEVNITAHDACAKLGTGQHEGPCSAEGVEHQAALPDGGHVGHEETQLRVHARVPDEQPLLQGKLGDQVSLAFAHQPPKEQAEGLLGQVVVVEPVVFKGAERHVGFVEVHTALYQAQVLQLYSYCYYNS